MKKYKIVKEKNEKNVSGLKSVFDYIKTNGKKVGTAFGAIIISIVFLFTIFTNHKDEINIDNAVSIICQQLQDDEATKIKEYIDISYKLNEFIKTNKIVGVSEEELAKIAQDTYLESSKDLEKEIQELENSKLSNEEKQKRIIYLMVQNYLLNGYLYDSYSTVNSILEDALREYVAEQCGILDKENLSFNTIIPTRDGYIHYNVYYKDEPIDIKLDSEVKKAMYILESITKTNDPNNSDNNQYNEDRNEILENGLKQAAGIYEIVVNEDIYSVQAARRFRKSF